MVESMASTAPTVSTSYTLKPDRASTPVFLVRKAPLQQLKLQALDLVAS